ncbi:MAG: metal-sensitive transcriptional regulator [Candidatus Omnitrophica bacterium]|nr:metal-sensitive transcriptional regulator [Candidatus Omnitrophota bacterium]
MPHHDKIVALKRIEGQVRGVQKMIDEQRYCVDILNATSAVIGALKKVESRILKDHLNACARTAFEGKSEAEKEKKMQEIFRLLEGNRG